MAPFARGAASPSLPGYKRPEFGGAMPRPTVAPYFLDASDPARRLPPHATIQEGIGAVCCAAPESPWPVGFSFRRRNQPVSIQSGSLRQLWCRK